MTEDKSSSPPANIYKSLETDKKINIYGPGGVGKTRVAKRLSERAMRECVFDFTLWVFMCIDYTKDSLSLSIARQLFLLPTSEDEEWEDEDNTKNTKKDDDVTRISTEEILEKINQKLKGRKVLLILDDDAVDGSTKKQKQDIFWSVWEQMLPNSTEINLKMVFISRSIRGSDPDITDKNAFEVKALPDLEQSKSLLIEKLDTRVKNYDVIKELGKKFIDRVKVNVPGRITMLAKAVSYLGLEPSGVSILKKELEEASAKYKVSRLLCLGHDVLPIGVLKDLVWRGHHFFRDSGSVHFSELITYWILEGFLGSDTMTKLYKKGHGIFMELMDCGVLKCQEGGYVFMDKSLIEPDDLYQYQHVHQNASLGLATLFTSNEECFGRITHEDGMLKTPRTRKKQSSKEISGENSKEQSSDERGQNLSTLLLDGIHFSEQEMLHFLESEKNLQALGLFNTTIKSLPNSLTQMPGLRVLVLRGCEFLQDIKFSALPLQNPIDLEIKNLIALEISQGRSMKYLKSSFFKNMSNLKSLHLSGLQITKLPATIYNLHKLQWLIIKDCPLLKKLESISKLDNLMVVDLSGNRSLDTVDKNFLSFNKLQTLNLSKTLVPTTPLLKNIKQLTHLLCRECTTLGRLRGLTSLTSLQTIDLTDSIKFEEFHDSSLQSLSNLRTLTLSGTCIDRLPSNISKPRYLYLKSCLELKQLSCIQSLENLEVLDLSGSKNLCKIQDDFFDRMESLRILNISDTNIVRLPSLSKLSKLRELFLSGCKSLTHLPLLESPLLEILDVSECSVLQEIENKSFVSMTCLQMIDFSGTQIKSFPALPNECKLLHHLLLKSCTDLKNLELNVLFPNLRELNLSGITCVESADFVTEITTLRVLDLSYTCLKQLPSMSKLINLTHLSLAGCPFTETELDLNFLSNLEVLNLSGTSIKKLPNLMNSNKLQKLMLKDCSIESFHDVKLNDPTTLDRLSTFSHLDYIEFPNIKVESSSEHQWHICLLSNDDKPPVFLNGGQFLNLVINNNNWPLGGNHLCSIPVKMEGETDLQRHQLVFGDVYLQTCRFSNYKESKSLQIRGFDHIPNGIDNIIREVDLFFLIDCKLKVGSPSSFDTSMFRNLNGCWIERCHEMITIFHDNPDFDISIVNLGIVNNHRLQNIYDGKQPFGRFDSLKSLYLDTCPSITTVFPSSWLPNNLESLQIKNCDKIESLFETEVTLPNLQTLLLWELPELKALGVSVSSLQTLKICECPKLKLLGDRFEIPTALKTLWIAGATTLKNLNSKNNDQVYLESLKLESCPMLEYIISKCSTLAKCKIMEIKSCEKIGALLEDVYNSLPMLDALLLEDLPKLKSLGFSCPQREVVKYYECPNLKIPYYD